jgi:hypothetical protein
MTGLDPGHCPTCGKVLSPYWRDTCKHCGTPFTPELAAARLAAGYNVTDPRGRGTRIVYGVVTALLFVWLLIGFLLALAFGLLRADTSSTPTQTEVLLWLSLIADVIILVLLGRQR